MVGCAPGRLLRRGLGPLALAPPLHPGVVSAAGARCGCSGAAGPLRGSCGSGSCGQCAWGAVGRAGARADRPGGSCDGQTAAAASRRAVLCSSSRGPRGKTRDRGPGAPREPPAGHTRPGSEPQRRPGRSHALSALSRRQRPAGLAVTRPEAQGPRTRQARRHGEQTPVLAIQTGVLAACCAAAALVHAIRTTPGAVRSPVGPSPPCHRRRRRSAGWPGAERGAWRATGAPLLRSSA